MVAGALGMLSSEYVRVKRKNTTVFLYVNFTDTASEVRAKINAVTKVPVSEIKLYLDSSGEVALDENKTLAEQKVWFACNMVPQLSRLIAPVRLKTTKSCSWYTRKRVQFPSRIPGFHLPTPRHPRPQVARNGKRSSSLPQLMLQQVN